MNARELALLASDHARKILAPRFRQGDAEYAFCRRLERGEFLSIVPLYAGWHRAMEEIRAEYEALDRKNAFKRWFTSVSYTHLVSGYGGCGGGPAAAAGRGKRIG